MTAVFKMYLYKIPEQIYNFRLGITYPYPKYLSSKTKKTQVKGIN